MKLRNHSLGSNLCRFGLSIRDLDCPSELMIFEPTVNYAIPLSKSSEDQLEPKVAKNCNILGKFSP